MKTNKKSTLFNFLIFLFILIIIMVYFGFRNPLPLMACVLVLFGSTWAQLTEGLDILKRFEIVSFGLVIIGIILSIYLLFEEFYSSGNQPATLTAIWKMLTSYSNARSIPIYEIMLCLVSSFVWGFLASTLKNNKEDVFIWIIVLFLVHIWGAERSETPVYSGSFFSYIWEPTTNTIHHPTASIESEPQLTQLGKNIWSILKFGVIGIALLFFLSFLIKYTNNKEDWKVIIKGVLLAILFLSILALAGIMKRLPDNWKIIKFLKSMGDNWSLYLVLFCLFFLILFFLYKYYKNQIKKT